MEHKEIHYVPMIRLEVIREKTIPYATDCEISCPEKVVQYVKPLIQYSDREVVLVICVDATCHPLSLEVASVGSVSCAMIDPRTIFRHAILSNACGIIVVHNHPSAAPAQPSLEDKKITKRLREAAELLEIDFFDSLIVASDGSIARILDDE